MRPSRLVPDPGLTPCMAHSKFDMLANAFLNVTEIMRYHDVETVTEKICTIYAAITGNEYLMASITTSHTNPTIALRQELSAFIDTRIIYIISSAISCIKEHFGLTDDVIAGSSFKIGERVISNDVGMNRHSLELVEFDILRTCEYILQLKRLDNVQTNRSEHEEYDLRSMLTMLIRQFDIISTKLLSPKVGKYVNARILERNDDDLASTKSIVILGYLIARLSICMVFVREHNGISCISNGYQYQKDLVDDEYAKYSNAGSMTYSGMLCCFKYTRLLPMAVISDDGHLSTIEKQFLLNLLILSKVV